MMDLKEKLLAEMKQNELARANGRVMRALNVLYPKYNSLRGIQIALSDDGIGEELYTASVDFLALEGYILLRTVKDHVPVPDLADHSWVDLEGKLSGKGTRLLEGGMKDNLVNWGVTWVGRLERRATASTARSTRSRRR